MGRAFEIPGQLQPETGSLFQFRPFLCQISKVDLVKAMPFHSQAKRRWGSDQAGVGGFAGNRVKSLAE
jgi:hypothetical protein